MESLIGKKITEIHLSHDAEYLYIVLDHNTCFKYIAEGDCCSVSWFTDIVGVESLIGATVSEVHEMEIEDTDDSGCIENYGYKIKTDKGYAEIMFRNESNGYYCGWVNEPYECHYTDIPTDAKKITENYPI